MTDDQYIELLKAQATDRGAQVAHERVCAERQRQVEDRLARIDKAVTETQASVTTAVAGMQTSVAASLAEMKRTVSSSDSRTEKWVERGLLALIGALFTFSMWAAQQLWMLNHHG